MANEIWIERTKTTGGDDLFIVKATTDAYPDPATVGGTTTEAEARAVVYGVQQGLKMARQELPSLRYDAHIREAVE